MRVSWLLLCALLVLTASSCAKLPDTVKMDPSDLKSFDAIPAEYGELVSVTFAPQADGGVRWRELWFENEETGRLTYVPVRLPDWSYYPKMVRTIDRAGGES